MLPYGTEEFLSIAVGHVSLTVALKLWLWPALPLPILAAGDAALGSRPSVAPDGQATPHIALVIDDREFFHRGDNVRVRFTTDGDGYATVFRVDTDGRVRVLFPRDPWTDNFVRGDRSYDVPDPYGRSPASFEVDDYAGIGYVFALVSRDPFDYTPYVLNDHWDYRAVANRGRISGDPYIALSEVAARILPAEYTMFGHDIVPYFVERRYDYPRFLCYDCHRYAPYPVWDPYRDWCATFRVVIYDDVRRYPSTAYPATDVVMPRGMVLEPQFVIRPRASDQPFIERVHGQPGGRRPEHGATGRDVGGVGTIPTPARDRDSRGVGGFVRRFLGGDDDDAPKVPGRHAPDSGAARPTPTLERRMPASAPSRQGQPARQPQNPLPPRPAVPRETTSTPVRRPTTAPPSTGRSPQGTARPPASGRPAATPARRPGGGGLV
jgi:Domain of unknown function (DUF4384)